jgi:hypothetical protein
MTKINCQKGQSMIFLNPFLILIQLLFVILISRGEVGAADASPCAAFLHPLESKVEANAAQGEASAAPTSPREIKMTKSNCIKIRSPKLGSID